MKKTASLVRAAVIAAMYAVLTVTLPAISYGNIQLRVSEALTVLPLFYFEAVPGLAIGCLISNILYSPLDMLTGTAATLIAALLTFVLKKWYLGVIPPIVINALMVPLVFLTMPDMPAYHINVLTVAAGQAIAVLGLGIPLYFSFRALYNRHGFLRPDGKQKK